MLEDWVIRGHEPGAHALLECAASLGGTAGCMQCVAGACGHGAVCAVVLPLLELHVQA